MKSYLAMWSLGFSAFGLWFLLEGWDFFALPVILIGGLTSVLSMIIIGEYRLKMGRGYAIASFILLIVSIVVMYN